MIYRPYFYPPPKKQLKWLLSCNEFMTKTSPPEIRQILLKQSHIGWRYDVAIARLVPEYSRSKISTWLKAGLATTLGRTIIGKERIKQVSTIDLVIKNQLVQNWQAEAITLNIIAKDDHIILVNKPAGLITHPGAGNTHNTLANALLYYDPQLAQLDRAGIVHRLDKDTSGLLVVARSRLAQKSLVQQLQNHQIYRQYVAICCGNMIAGGTINKAIARHPKDRTKQAIDELSGKPAISHYRILERFKNHTLISVILETGRTHQIRLHLSHIGHGLVADKVYGKGLYYPKGASHELRAAIKTVPRHCLHAQKLSLVHPKTHKKIAWQTELPADMIDFLTQLRQYDVPTN